MTTLNDPDVNDIIDTLAEKLVASEKSAAILLARLIAAGKQIEALEAPPETPSASDVPNIDDDASGVPKVRRGR